MHPGLTRASHLLSYERGTNTRSLADAGAVLHEMGGILTQITGWAYTTYAVWVGKVFQSAVSAPIAWVSDASSLPFPPDIAGAGVDVGRLLFVTPKAHQQRMRAVERLLGSALCSLIVIDCSDGTVPEPGLLARYMRMSDRNQVAILVLTPQSGTALSPAIRLFIRVSPEQSSDHGSRLRISVLRSRTGVRTAYAECVFAPRLY